MASQTLDQIVKSLGSIYDPQIKSIQRQQAAIPASMQIEENALGAKQTQAFDQILGGARQRGLGFAGIPLGEQAKYSATEYMPALARLRQDANSRRMSLEDAILGLRRDKFSQGRSIYDADRSFREQQRQFNVNLAWQKEQARAQERAARAASAGFSPSYGGGSASLGSSTKLASTDPVQQTAYNDVRGRVDLVKVGNHTDGWLQSDFLATARSAARGNQKDLVKLQIYRKLRPDLFNPKQKYRWEK